ncbi:MAG: radical SAM protein, partial [Alphaproteobacteria bacterium]
MAIGLTRMPDAPLPASAARFRDPDRTAAGEPRARIDLVALRTLWFNTGTLCNLACSHCYIESTPKNDALVYLRRDEVRAYLDEIAGSDLPTEEIGLTGGEPFMNPDIVPIMEDVLGRGFRLLVLTNAMAPMWHRRAALLDLKARHGDRLTLRVSVDHFQRARHEE